MLARVGLTTFGQPRLSEGAQPYLWLQVGYFPRVTVPPCQLVPLFTTTSACCAGRRNG